MSTFTLVARGLLNSEKDDNEDKHVCPVENTEGPAIVPFVGDLTFHQFASILSGACAIVSTIMVLVLIILHAVNYSNPVQQRQIIRILCLIPWVAIFSFLIVWQETAGEYLDPSLDVGCSVALSAFLLFMCDLVLSHREGFDSLFGAGAQAQPDKKGRKSPMSFKRQWYSVLQFIPTSIIVWIATAASLAAGTYCKQSNSVHFAHIWLTVITAYSMVIAIIASLVFYKNHKKMLQKHNIILKLAAFKGVLGLNFLQSFIISILSGHGVLKPTQYMTFHDINTGLASLLLACEMPLFAILLVFAFSPAPYRSQGPPAASPFNAIVDAINISDILSAFIRGPMRLVRDQQRQILRQNSMRVDMGPSSGDDISYEHSRV